MFKKTNTILCITMFPLMGIMASCELSPSKFEENSYCEVHKHLQDGDKIGTCQIDEKGQEIIVWKDRICPSHGSDNLKFIFSLFIVLALGVLWRTFLRATKLNIPYTIVLMLTGFIIGLGTSVSGNIPFVHKIDGKRPLSFCSFWSGYTKVARIHPKLILYTFLPVLIFESAFNMKAHIFMRSAWQILMIALPGLLITTFITAIVSKLFMSSYNWSFAQASLFGSIISATDPVAVVAVLRELGISDTLSTMIEGESLLNDGIAIVLYEVFQDIVHVQSEGNVNFGAIFWKFLSICIGGPLMGCFTAKIACLALSSIFNDATVEITITLVAAYLTYYFGELFGLSGVVAVVVLGIRMKTDITSISPKVEALVHEFWEMLGYLANTVLFVLVGIVISETALNQISLRDGIYLIGLFIFLNLIRFFMLTMLMPLLSRIGYGLKWKELLVMAWSGLRGAVGLCLALEVYRNKDLCLIERDQLGPKILFHTAGIVFLTLLVNGGSTRLLLNWLKLGGVSEVRVEELNNTMMHIMAAQVRALAVQKQVRFLADANWDIVDQYTRITNPFDQKPTNPNPAQVTRLISARLEKENKNVKGKFFQAAKIIVQAKESDYMHEARLRLLKALKIFFWKQFAQGLLTDSATQILVKVAEDVGDEENRMIHWKVDFSKHLEAKGIFQTLKNRLIAHFGNGDFSIIVERPKNGFRQTFWRLATWEWLESFMHFLVLVHTVLVGFQLFNQFKNLAGEDHTKGTGAFLALNISFGLIYTNEFLVKTLGIGLRHYFSDKFNCADIILMLSDFLDIGLTVSGQNLLMATAIILFLSLLLRLVFKTTRTIAPLLPRIYKFIDRRTKQSLFLGYDIGTGFISAIDDVLKFLSQIAQHPTVFEKLKESLEFERFEALRAIGLMQKCYPEIAIGVKTRQATRTVLNNMQETLDELKHDGLLDDKDSAILAQQLEERIKYARVSPSTIKPPTPETLLENVTWILGNPKLLGYFEKHAVLRKFNAFEEICSTGDPPVGIYVIISGMVKMHYVPSDEIIAARSICGQIPNKDFFYDVTFEEEETDLFSTGTVIGELGVLTGQKVAATITCETTVTAYFISGECMKDALDIFDDRIDSLESRLWRSCGLRIAAALLPSDIAFQTWTRNRIRMHLERSAVPVRTLQDRIIIPGFISTAILLQGQVMDSQTRDVFIAPTVLPEMTTKFSQCEKGVVDPRIMFIAHEDIDFFNYEPNHPCSHHHQSLMPGTRTPATSVAAHLLPDVRFETRQQRRMSVAFNLPGRPSKF